MRSCVFLIFFLFLASSCQTTPLSEFVNLKMDMSKDEVLEKLGSPIQTEYRDGKEKWAYRFYTGPENSQEILKQVTFYNGHVISFGDNTEEVERLKSIRADNERRELRRKKKTQPLNARHPKSIEEPESISSEPITDEYLSPKPNDDGPLKESPEGTGSETTQ